MRFFRIFLLLALLSPALAAAPSWAVSGPQAPTAADVPADALPKIKAFLARYPALRVRMGSSPGSGHQQAGLRMIQRLRELGYTGRVQLIYADTTGDKLKYLLPGFDAAEKGMQKVNSPSLGALELVAESQAAPFIKAEKMELGLSGAADEFSRVGQNAGFNVDYFLQLQPRRWAFKTSSREIRFGNEEPIPLQHLWNLGAGIKEETIHDWPSFLAKELSASPAPIREKAGGISALAAANADFLPAYSIDYTGHPESVLTEVMRGVKKAAAENPEKFTKPIVVPILTEFKSEAHRTAVQTAMEGLGHKMVNVKAIDLGAHLQAARPGEILFVEVGQVPPPVFEGLFKKATLPALLEGKNLTNAMVDAGKPFLNILGNIDDIKPELFADGVSEEARRTVINAHEAFTLRRFQSKMFDGVNQKGIADFYVAAKEEGGAVKSFFTGLRRNPGALEQDLVAMSLLELEKQVTGRANGTIAVKPPVPAGPVMSACPQQFSRFRGGGRAYSQ